MYIYAICIIFNSFSICLNNLYPAIKYTLEKAKVIVHNSESCRLINFHVSVILHPERTTETDIYYKIPTSMIIFLTPAHTHFTLEIMSCTI